MATIGRLPATERTEDRLLRVSRLTPYRKGMGPVFTLRMFDAYETIGPHGHTRVSFELHVSENGKSTVLAFRKWVGLSAGTVIDSDDALYQCWTAAAMKPGDTDSEFFEPYAAEALEIVSEHGEMIGICAADRYSPNGERD